MRAVPALLRLAATLEPELDPFIKLQFMKALADHRVTEGLPLIIDFVFKQKGWGDSSRKDSGPQLLRPYGGVIKPYITDIEAYLKVMAEIAKKDAKKIDKRNTEYRKLQEEIMKANVPELISIKEYIGNDPGPVIVK